MQYHTIFTTICNKGTYSSRHVHIRYSSSPFRHYEKNIFHKTQSVFIKEAIISLQRHSWGTVCYCLSSGFLKATKQNQWLSGVTDPSLLIFKHGDGWLKTERERVETKAGKTGMGRG